MARPTKGAQKSVRSDKAAIWQGSEDDFQMAAARLLDLSGFVWFHPANERKATIQAGLRLKRKGVKSGLPDCMILTPSHSFNGAAIELKSKNGIISDNQKSWADKLELTNWYVIRKCQSLDDVINFIEWWGNGIK